MHRSATIFYFAAVLIISMIVGCATTLPTDFDRPESYALTDTQDTELGLARAAEQAAHPGKSGFLLLENGLDAYVARAVLARRAERSLDVQYYLYHDDPPASVKGSQVRMVQKITDLNVEIQKEMLIANAYFIPDEETVENFREWIAAGVRVSILTNSLASNDVAIVNSDYKLWRRPVIEAGAELYKLGHDARDRILCKDYVKRIQSVYKERKKLCGKN